MAATYTISKKSKLEDGRLMVQGQIAYVAQAYASGVSVVKASLGLPNVLDHFLIEEADSASSVNAKFDKANSKIRVYEEGAAVYAEHAGALTLTVKFMAIGY